MKKTFLDKAKDYIDSKRVDIQQSRDRYSDMFSHLQETVQELDIGIHSIKVGEETILTIDEPLTPEKISHNEELFWINELNKGKSLFVLTVNNDSVGYYGKEHLHFSNQPLENLLDIELVKQFAPTSKVYAPNEPIPWPSIIYSSSFKIFITERSELEALQKNIDLWVKTEWHDTISSTQKYAFKAENVFHVWIYTGFTADLNQKISDFNQATEELEAVQKSSEWASLSQAELKKSLAALLQIEDHPKFGKDIQRIISDITPMLASSMGDKQEVKLAQAKVDKAQNNLYKNITNTALSWKERFQKIP